MKLWQIKWFRVGVIIISSLLALGATAAFLFIFSNSNSLSPTPSPKIETPLPSLQGQLPEPKTLGVATKNESSDPILMYHHIQDISNPANVAEKNLYLSPIKLKEEMEYLSESGYKTAVLSELFYNLPDKRVVITFDDGYKDVIDNALPVLKELGFRGVVFIIVNNVGKPGYMNFNDLRVLNQEGWKIGSHSLTHPNFKTLSNEAAKKQIFESKNILEDKLNIKVEYFCYPAGRYNETTINLVKEAGYVGAVTIEPGAKNSKDNIFELKRIRIDGNTALSGFKSIFK